MQNLHVSWKLQILLYIILTNRKAWEIILTLVKFILALSRPYVIIVELFLPVSWIYWLKSHIFISVSLLNFNSISIPRNSLEDQSLELNFYRTLQSNILNLISPAPQLKQIELGQIAFRCLSPHASESSDKVNFLPNFSSWSPYIHWHTQPCHQ